MTKKIETPKTATAANDYVASVKEAIENVQKQVEVPSSVRDFVKRTAGSGKDRAGDLQKGAYKVTDGAEKLAGAFVSGYAGFIRGLIDATHANLEHTFNTVEKIAGAKTVNEAVQLQVDFVRDNTRANYDRVRDAAESARETVVDGAKTVQEEVSKLYSQKAA